MAKEHTTSLPVMSDSTQAELMAALARVADVPAGRTLIDEMSDALWAEEDFDYQIEAGSVEHVDRDLDMADAEFKQIA
ncbi:hypothetical protein KUV28_16890 [Ferrimonas balearica]|nr:hypothetical protein [Ferrimonas balearica]